jgi:hypothetical protein
VTTEYQKSPSALRSRATIRAHRGSFATVVSARLSFDRSIVSMVVRSGYSDVMARCRTPVLALKLDDTGAATVDYSWTTRVNLAHPISAETAGGNWRPENAEGIVAPVQMRTPLLMLEPKVACSLETRASRRGP